MVRISELHESDDDSMEHLNLDNYNSDDYEEYLSNNMETTPPVVTEVESTIKQDPSAAPPAVTVTVQLEEPEDLYNQKRAFRHQRVANRKQEHQGDNYDYSNSDLHNVINIARDARNVIISRKKECEEIEAYIPSSNCRIPAHASASFKKHKLASTLPQGKPRSQHNGETSLGGDKVNKALLRKCFMHPKCSHTVFECNSLRKALGAPLVKETLPKILSTAIVTRITLEYFSCSVM
jgi:hypothetical protein